MEFISGIVWRNLNKATFDTLNNRSPGQYDIRLGSADYSAFFDGLPRENATNIGGFSLTVPLTSFPTADTGASTPLVVRYMGNDSSRRDWNIPSQRSATAYSLWRPDRRLPNAPSDKSFLVLLKTYSGKYYGRLILARELDYLPEDLKDLLLSNERGCRMLATASPQALDLYLTLLREYNVLLYGPPGTGKTFLMQEVKRLFERDGALWTFQDTLEYGSSEAPMISAVDPTQAGHSRTIWTTIHQSYSYEEFILGVTTASDSHTLLKITPRPGILLELTEFARQPGCRSLLLADEINRGNVSRLFGEFITCMEPDKRLDEDGGETPTTVSVRLPYLQEGEVLPVPAPGTPLVFRNPMRMPKHVYTLASMNSVDSSTNPLDSALGRRFFRYEVRPDAALLSAHLGVSAGDRHFTPGAVASDPVAIKRLAFLFWSFLNEKIALFAGCDYQLGHSYLWPLASAETGAQALTAFSSAVRHKLIPQLREIFSARPEQLIHLLQLRKPSPIRLLEPDALDEELGASAAILWDGLFSCSDARLSEWVLRLLMEHGAAEPSPAGGA